MIDPSKIITKIKFHLLVHIDEDAVEFDPLIGVMTEIFECFNAIFRYCSILSNHLAPSRDIAKQLGDHDGLKHRLTGSYLCIVAIFFKKNLIQIQLYFPSVAYDMVWISLVIGQELRI